MGILDDAIREHLDLKRRLGADESELEQLESEAFGPSARPGDPDFPEQGGADGDSAVAVQAPADAGEASTEAPAAFEAAEDEAGAEAPAVLADAEEAPTPEATFTTQERDAIGEQATEFFDQTAGELDLGELDLDLEEDLEEIGDEAIPDEPAEEGGEPEPAPAEEGDAEPEEEAPPTEAAASPDEDVLEETPEFLQDSPEDDELWFEQGEPKDFDF